jgi:hypothetical protein
MEHGPKLVGLPVMYVIFFNIPLAIYLGPDRPSCGDLLGLYGILTNRDSSLFGVEWNRTQSTITGVSTGLWYQLRMMDDECGAVVGMIDEGNRSTRRKQDPVPLCPPQIPQDVTWVRTRTVTVGSRRLAA